MLIAAAETADQERLPWFSRFGESVRHIVMNVHAYNKGLEFGFTAIELDHNGWLKRPELLDIEEINLGDTSRYGRYSTIGVAHGPNGVWTSGIRCSYGVAGESSWLSVFGSAIR